MPLGVVGSWWITGYAAIAALALWLVLFFKAVHLDMDKAFGKYRMDGKGGK